MKFLMSLMLLASVYTGTAMAGQDEHVGETETECPMMSERNERVNPKINLDDQQSRRPRKLKENGVVSQ